MVTGDSIHELIIFSGHTDRETLYHNIHIHTYLHDQVNLGHRGEGAGGEQGELGRQSGQREEGEEQVSVPLFFNPCWLDSIIFRSVV